MPIVNGLGTSTNNNGHSLDDKSNVQVDFVWGNFPIQPNDVREDTPTNNGNTFPSTLLDPTVSFHNTVVGAYNGYPLYEIGNKDSYGRYQGSRGADTSTTVDYIKAPSVLGKTTADAIDALEDAGFVKLLANITRVNATSANSANIYAFNADVNYPLNSKITITAGKAAASSPVAVPAYVLGEWTVTAKATGYVTITGSGFTVADTTGINATENIRSGLKGEVNTITTATATTNTAKTITAISRTALSTEVSITASGAVAAYPIGTKITIGASTGIPTELVNTWTVTGNSSTNVVKFTGTLTTALALTTTELTGSASLTGATGTVNAQSIAADTASTAPGASITITPWA